MNKLIEVVLGKKMNLPKVVVGTIDGKPRETGKLWSEIILKELDIPPEGFEEACKEYKRRCKEEDEKKVYRNYGYIPDIMWLTCKLPNGDYSIQKNSYFQRLLPDNSCLHLSLDERKTEDYQLFGVPFLRLTMFNGFWAEEIPNLEEILSYRGKVADKINCYGFNFRPEDIKIYLEHQHWEDFKR